MTTTGGSRCLAGRFIKATLGSAVITVRGVVVCAMAAGVLVMAGAADPDAGQPAAPSRREFCVSPNGSDQAKGSEGEPWRTVQYAADHVAPGSVVLVRAGVYHESVTIANRGTPEAGLTLRGYPGERPVLDGEFRLADGIVLSWDNVRVSGLEIRNYLASGIQIRPRTDHATDGAITTCWGWIRRWAAGRSSTCRATSRCHSPA